MRPALFFSVVYATTIQCCSLVAVDIWAVGVIFLSLLSGHYPIFKASDDIEALSQIIVIFGSEEVQAAAKSYGKTFVASVNFSGSNSHFLKTDL